MYIGINRYFEIIICEIAISTYQSALWLSSEGSVAGMYVLKLILCFFIFIWYYTLSGHILCNFIFQNLEFESQ